MKKTIFYLTLTTLFLLTTASSCKKPTTPIPTGDHTFSCYIDGELFLPSDTSSWNPGPDTDGLSIYQYDSFFYVIVDNKDILRVYFNITNWSVGTFLLQSSNGWTTEDSHEINHAVIIKNGVKYLSKEDSGSVTFNEAEIDGEVNGTFSFTLYNENDDTDSIRVTNGKFNN